MVHTGGRFAVLVEMRSRKSTGIRLRTSEPPSRSSMITCTVQKLTLFRPTVFQVTCPVLGSMVRFGGEIPPPASASVEILQRNGSPSGSAAGTKNEALLVSGTVMMGNSEETGDRFPLVGVTTVATR